MVHNEVQQVKE